MNGQIKQAFQKLEVALFHFQNGQIIGQDAAIGILDSFFLYINQSFSNYNEVYDPLYTLLNKFENKKIALLLCDYLNRTNNPNSLKRIQHTFFCSTYKLTPELEHEALEILKSFIFTNNNVPHSVFDGNVIVPKIKDEMKGYLLTYIESLIDNSFATTNWDNQMIVTVLFSLELHKKVAQEVNALSSFYFHCTVLSDRLSTSSEYRIHTEIFHALIKCSYDDKCPENGFYLMSRCQNSKNDVIAGLLMLCLTLKNITSKGCVNDNLYRLFYEQFFATSISIGHYKLVKSLLSDLNDLFSLTDYQKANNQYRYFMALLSFDLVVDETLKEIHEYVLKNKTVIETSKANLGLVYLSLILAVKRNCPQLSNTYLFDSILLDFFKNLVGNTEYDKLYNQYFGTNIDLLKENAIKFQIQLLNARDEIEMEHILKSQHALILNLHNKGISENDLDCYLISMLFKTDYTLSVTIREHIPIRSLAETNNKTETHFDSYTQYLKQTLNIDSQKCFCWVSTDHDKFFSLSLFNNQFSNITIINNWDSTKIKNWLAQINRYLSNINDEKKRWSNNKLRLDMFSGICLENIPENASEILIVKDGWMSEFPHNLFLNSEREFIILKKPITNIISAEWYAKRKANNLPDFNIRAYLPLEDSDEAIKELHENKHFKRAIQKYNIQVENKNIPSKTLNGTINILVAHGANNISDFYAITTNNKTGNVVLDLNNIIGEGKIAILFICNAGKQKMSDYSHKVSSFTRIFLQKNYETVIAPAWDLYTSVPPIWLPKFLEMMESKHTVSEAFHSATKKVYELNNDPEYWACLHLYGNPNLRLE